MINPILASSARRRMRSWRTVIILTLYGALMFAFTLTSSFTVLGRQTMTISSMRVGIDNYIYSVALQFVLLLLVAPGMTAGAISGERERQTLDLILVTHTGALRIALGKLLESFGFLVLVLLSSLPMLSVVLLFGGISFTQVLTVLLFMTVSALGALSVGLFASALFKRTAAATVVAYLAVFAIGIGTLVPTLMNNETIIKYMNNPDMLASLDTKTLLSSIPAVLFTNPGVGLLSLMADQTGLLERTFQMIPSGYAFYQIFDKADFGLIAWINMGAMFAISMILTFLSALLIRPRIIRVRARRKVAKELAA
jgi:ABC-type transport system involved in multi-copper enzyme maturation permease subunit